MLFLALISIAFARQSTHHFRAESNHLCDICTRGVKALQSKVVDFGAARETILNLCHSDESMDCTAPCQMFYDELQSGEITGIASGKAQDICVRHNWCEPESRTDLFSSLPAHNSETVEYVNRVQKQWAAGVYQGSLDNMSRFEFRKLLGAIVDPELRCKVHYRPFKNSNFTAPTSFDSAANWPKCAKVIGDIRDQSNCGCCWAFAAAEAASDRLCIASKGAFAVPLSAQDVCFCASEDGCGGGDITSPWEFIKKGAVTGGEYKGTGSLGEGFCSDFSLPHCHHHGPQGSDPYPAEGAPGCPSASSPQCPTSCAASAKAPHNDFESDKIGFEGEVLQVSGADNIARAIMEGGPVETAFSVYSDFANYTDGIYHHTEGSQLGGHAVRIVGWGVEDGEKYWKVANSWNPHWGEKGYFRIRRGINDCGIEDMVTASSATAKWGKPANP